MSHTFTEMEPGYSGAHALVVGINHYEHTSPLVYAENDAKALASLLVSDLGFDEKSITLLLGHRATKKGIMRTFLSYDDRRVVLNEKVMFFFAGHGHTERLASGEVGYLIPYDANFEDYSTLIRWDDLTKNADRIPAKHVFFIIDACYGGLAVNRDTVPHTHRYFKDITTRRARQVLAAGKADQPVSDYGGPLPDHSVFSGHLLVALKNDAGQDEVLTATDVMAYVTKKVGTDPHSKQTPHYGQIEGDGDFVFRAPQFSLYSGAEHPLSTYQKKIQHPGIEVTNAIIAQLRSPNASSRELAITYIGNLLEDEFGEAYELTKNLLLQPIGDTDLHVKRKALSVFCDHVSEGDGEFTAALIGALSDDDPEIRQLAAASLEKLGETASSAIDALVESLVDDDQWTAENAAYALRSICDDVESILKDMDNPRYLVRYRDYLD